MTTIHLRPWQKRALELFVASDEPDFLAVATPGAGKTTFALTAARQYLAKGTGARLVVVAPTSHLKVQWAEAAERFGLHLEPQWTAADGLPSDLHGVVVTYQQVAANPQTLIPVSRNGFVIFDEIHHAGEERAWGDGVRTAFEGAATRLSISGTPFRSDTNSIPFVRYRLDEAEADFEYGYGDALSDRGVVRPVFFPRLDGHMEWVAPDGGVYSATFDDALDRTRSSQRLRTALSLEGEWLPAVLAEAHQRLLQIRQDHPEAGGLVIAMDQDHAKGIARILRDRFNVSAVVSTSDDPGASEKITAFANSSAHWIVAVRMVSEGVDIPRLRVGVYATTTTTELFFRQAVGRFVRWTRGLGKQRAYLFIPDDPRLRTWAHQIAEQRKHSLRKPEEDAETRPEPDGSELDTVGLGDDDDQLSLFAVLSATPADGFDEVALSDLYDDSGDDELLVLPDTDEAMALELAPLPALAGDTGGPLGPDGKPISPREHRQQLRDRNADLAKELVHLLGEKHGSVNFELNRQAGIKKISEATLDQLQKRIDAAERWKTRANYRLRAAAARR